jgi:predicted metal-binding membrane protein
MADQAPFGRIYRAQVPAATILQTVINPIKVVEGGAVSSVSYIPVAAVTGAASPSSRSYNLINKLQDGSGSTVVATLALLSGVNLVAFDEKAATLSATPANLVVAAGDVLQWQSIAVGGTGLADTGGGEVEVVVSRTA